MGSGTQQAVTMFSLSFSCLAGFYRGSRKSPFERQHNSLRLALKPHFRGKLCKFLLTTCHKVPANLVLFLLHPQLNPTLGPSTAHLWSAYKSSAPGSYMMIHKNVIFRVVTVDAQLQSLSVMSFFFFLTADQIQDLESSPLLLRGFFWRKTWNIIQRHLMHFRFGPGSMIYHIILLASIYWMVMIYLLLI